MAELSDKVLSRLGLTAIGDRHCLHVLCANAEKQHQSAAAVALSKRMALSADEVAIVEGVAVVDDGILD